MSWSMARSRCMAPARSFSPDPKCAPPTSKEAIDERLVLGRHRIGLLDLPAAHRDHRRRGGDRQRPGSRQDLESGLGGRSGNDRALGRGAFPAFRSLPGGAAVAAILCRDAGHFADRRVRRLSFDASAANGHAIFLGVRESGAQLAAALKRPGGARLTAKTSPFSVDSWIKKGNYPPQGGTWLSPEGLRTAPEFLREG